MFDLNGDSDALAPAKLAVKSILNRFGAFSLLHFSVGGKPGAYIFLLQQQLLRANCNLIQHL